MNSASLESAIASWLSSNHGIEGRLTRLGGENLNFLVVSPSGKRFVFKAMERQAALGSLTLESHMLEHIRASGFSLELPYLLPDREGRIESPIELPLAESHHARLLSCVDGELLARNTARSRELLIDVGRSLALLDQALEGFEHPTACRGHPWELTRAGMHRDKAGLIGDRELRERVRWAFDFWDGVAGEFADLPCQVIHGDANPENILVAGDQVTGFVDFGDACFNPRVCEVAIALSYLMTGQKDPVPVAAEMLAGYCGVVELSEAEQALLPPLVCGRLAVTICMATARQSIDPENPNWFVSLEPAAGLLAQLHETGLEAWSA